MKKLSLISVMVVCMSLCFAPVASSVEFYAGEYDNGTFYAITTSNQLVSINPSTGLMTIINSNVGDLRSGKSFHGKSIDPNTHIWYGLKGDAGVNGSGYVVMINVQTGAVTVSPALHF